MPQNFEIHLRLDPENKGGFYIDKNNKPVAEMIIEIDNDKLIVYHTEVDDELKGMHVGQLLLDEMVKYARTNNLKVLPFCPFVSAQFRRHEDLYRDIWLKQ